MKAIIVGAGQLGFEVAARLAGDGHDVVLVERSPARLSAAAEQLDVLPVHGNGASSELLKQVGAAEADVLVAVTEQDETNILSCLVAKRLGTPFCAARVRNQDYLSGILRPRLGLPFDIDMVINPDHMAALEIVRLLKTPAATYVDEFADGRITLLKMKVEAGSAITAGPLREINLPNCIVAAVVRAGTVLIPNGDTRIQAGDSVVLVGPTGQLHTARGWVSSNGKRIESVVLAGGGRIGEAIVNILRSQDKRGFNLKWIDRDAARCERLAAEYPEALVLHGDAEKIEFLREERVGEADAFVAVTDVNHTNILASMVARELGVREVIATVSREDYVPLAERAGADAVIVPRLLTASGVVRILRRRHVVSMSFLEEGQAQAMELAVQRGARVVGRPLRDLKLRAAVVGGVVRGTEVLVPNGSTVLEPGDRVVVFTLSEQVKQLEGLFSP